MDGPTASFPDPPPVTFAVVALSGEALRYGELERGGPRQDLRRLGTCDFDFAVDDAVLGLDGPSHLDTVASALREVFRETAARSLLIVVHPPSLPGFFSPLPESLGVAERYEQLRQEAALLADVSTAQPVRIRAVPVRTEVLVVEDRGEPYRWHHVIHVPEAVHARLTLLAKSIGAGTYDLVDSTHAAAAVVSALDRQADEPPDPMEHTLILGAYPKHVELSLLRDGLWMHGQYGPSGAPADAAYFASAFIDRLGLTPDDIARLYIYGDAADAERFDLLSELLGVTPALLDPLAVFGRSPAGAPPEALAAYAPCVGAVLR